MALRHGDPLVWNADTGQHQNASYVDPATGVPIGVGVGSDTGSEVFAHPSLGKTLIRTSDGRRATVIAAHRYRTGSANETQPGLVCTLLFSPGAPGEQLGHLVFSGLAQGTGHAQLMTSDSPDGVWLSRSETGLLSVGSVYGTDYAFTPVTELNSHSSTLRLKAPYQIIQEQGAGAGKVLTSDAGGTASWQPSGGTGTVWWLPGDDGLLSANGDPATAVVVAGGSNKGQISLSRLPVRSATSISDLVGLYLPGSVTGAGTVFLGIYDSTGALVCQTADFSALLATLDGSGVSPFSVPLVGGPFTLAPDNYWIGELPVYTNLTFGQPSFWGWAQNEGNSFDITGSPATTRAGLYGAAGTYTVLPGSITPASIAIPVAGGSLSPLTWWGAK